MGMGKKRNSRFFRKGIKMSFEECEILDIEDCECDDEFVYNLEVEDNHNYIADGILVSNCHSLADKAAGALLKVIEEPPEHAMFILATTEPNNVMNTIRSRCQCLDLQRINTEQISKRLMTICRMEKVPASEEAMALIARSGNGSMRDAITNLEIVLGKSRWKEFSSENVKDILGSSGQHFFLQMIKYMWAGDYSKSITLLNEEIARGTSPEQIMMNMLESSHDMMVCKATNNFDLIYVDDSVKDNWIKAIEKIDYKVVMTINKMFLSYCSNLKFSPRPDYLLDHVIIECIDKIKENKS